MITNANPPIPVKIIPGNINQGMSEIQVKGILDKLKPPYKGHLLSKPAKDSNLI